MSAGTLVIGFNNFYPAQGTAGVANGMYYIGEMYEAIIFKNEGPEVHATRRWQSDSRGHTYDYWLKVATRHQEMQSEPTLDEGFDKVHRISYEEIVSGFVFE